MGLGIPESEILESKKNPKDIYVNSGEEQERIRAASRLARRVLDLAHTFAKPGNTTEQIDAAAHEFILQNGAYPSPFNYYHFPKSLCT